MVFSYGVIQKTKHRFYMRYVGETTIGHEETSNSDTEFMLTVNKYGALIGLVIWVPQSARTCEIKQ